ncbi:hypothetical protein [Halomarina oriensis]|uniref:Uncharacterized protein n=1 Tax=Halomarina oriensis TaxID=671145 RepID=A0A6B0GS66_9EURY|nr:hypothetical protein [Halomarina oriensis]MWG36529.1 hypothetical protein [Halomarina oriensis]
MPVADPAGDTPTDPPDVDHSLFDIDVEAAGEVALTDERERLELRYQTEVLSTSEDEALRAAIDYLDALLEDVPDLSHRLCDSCSNVRHSNLPASDGAALCRVCATTRGEEA